MGTLKTNDEIKKEISETMEELSWVVEGGDAHDLQDACDKAHACLADTLSLIERLENDASFYKNISKFVEKTNAEALSLIDSLLESNTERTEKIGWLMTELQCMKAERDDLREGIKQAMGCRACKHFDDDTRYVSNECKDCEKWCNWQWRGVQKEESND